MELAMVDLNKIAPDQIKNDLPQFRGGDHIKVHVRVIEGEKERIQSFEGDVISIRGAGINRTFTVRKISSGVGVERIFRLNSPKIAKIELLKKGNVRRAKLYYLRGLSGKAARIKSKKS
jgi:large subunit ribosomal protein L19